MLHFLIADDHMIMRQAIVQVIKDDWPDAFCMEAADGPELIDKATDAPWDIIISDISMPSLSGLEALAVLRTRIPHIPILLTSIHTENSYALKALRSGAAGFIPKPLIQVELARAVITVLSGKKYLTAEQAIKIGNL